MKILAVYLLIVESISLLLSLFLIVRLSDKQEFLKYTLKELQFNKIIVIYFVIAWISTFAILGLVISYLVGTSITLLGYVVLVSMFLVLLIRSFTGTRLVSNGSLSYIHISLVVVFSVLVVLGF